MYYASRVHRGDEVRIRYMHSVEKSPVEGRFEIAEDRQLEAVETRMKCMNYLASVGTGLPNTVPDRTKIEDSWIVVDEGRKKLDEIRFFYSLRRPKYEFQNGIKTLWVFASRETTFR